MRATEGDAAFKNHNPIDPDFTSVSHTFLLWGLGFS